MCINALVEISAVEIPTINYWLKRFVKSQFPFLLSNVEFRAHVLVNKDTWNAVGGESAYPLYSNPVH